MVERDPLAGVLPVLQMPYHADASVDEAVLEQEVDWLLEQGVDGVTVAMVSEVLRLSDADRERCRRRSPRSSPCKAGWTASWRWRSTCSSGRASLRTRSFAGRLASSSTTKRERRLIGCSIGWPKRSGTGNSRSCVELVVRGQGRSHAIDWLASDETYG